MTTLTGETGATGTPVHTIAVPFDRYVIRVCLTEKNEFVGIVEVSAKESFLSQQQKIATRGVHDVSDLYEE